MDSRGGNEGDEILLLALRQIECAIPESVVSINDLTAEMLVEIVARSLWLISNGDVKVYLNQRIIIIFNIIYFLSCYSSMSLYLLI